MTSQQKQTAIALWRIVAGERVIVSRAARKKAALVLGAKSIRHPNGLWHYRVRPERLAECRSWYDNAGKLIAPEKFLASLWEKPVKAKRKPKAVDMLATYKAKLLSQNDS